MERRYTFGNDFPSRSRMNMDMDMDMDTDSMMTDDLNRVRDRFHERARTNRLHPDMEFDSWFDTGKDGFNQRPFKIPKEDERSAYVRNIPIFQENGQTQNHNQQPSQRPAANSNHGSEENLIHQAKSAIPRPVPPLKSTSPTPPQQPSAPPTLPKPKIPVRVTPSNGSDSGIDRAASKSPTDNNSESAGTIPRNLRAGSVGRGGLFEKERQIPVKLEAATSQPAPPSRSEPIPMGYTKIRDPNEPIPMGFEQRASSAPGDNQSPKIDRKTDLPKPKKPANDVGGVHRVPIVVKNPDGPRSASAPPKPTETSPPPPPAATVKTRTPLERIEDIMVEVKELEARINAFQGVRTDHECKLVDELLTRAVIKLDCVPIDGVEEVRTARKTAVRRVQDLATALEKKALAAGDRPKSKSPPSNGGTATTRIVIPMGPDVKQQTAGGDSKQTGVPV